MSKAPQSKKPALQLQGSGVLMPYQERATTRDGLRYDTMASAGVLVGTSFY